MKPLQLLDDVERGRTRVRLARARRSRPFRPTASALFRSCAPSRPGEEAAAQSRARTDRRSCGTSSMLARLDAIRARSWRVARRRRRDRARVDGRRARRSSPSWSCGAFAQRSIASTTCSPTALGARRLSNEAVRAVGDALAIGQVEDDRFYLADAFDAELAAARARLARAQAELDALRGRESGARGARAGTRRARRRRVHRDARGSARRAYPPAYASCARRRRICSARSTTAKRRSRRSHAGTPPRMRSPTPKSACVPTLSAIVRRERGAGLDRRDDRAGRARRRGGGGAVRATLRVRAGGA